MNPRRILLTCALAFGLIATAPNFDVGDGRWSPAIAEAARPKPTAEQARQAKARAKRRDEARKKSGRTQARGKRGKRVARVKLCSDVRSGGKRSRRRCRFVPEFQGHAVASARLRTEPLERPSGEVWVGSDNVRDEAKVNIYKADGTFDESALARLDEIFRCRRSGETRAVDPRLYEQLSRIYDHFGSQKIELVSGFRGAERNSSRHAHASAMDIRIKGVTIREMYDFAESLDPGGMGVGIYPRSGFVHVDFRAPGDQSYRWTDYSGPNGGGARKHAAKKRPGRTARAKRPTS